MVGGILEMLEAHAKSDFSQSTGIQLIGQLRRELILIGFDAQSAEAIVSPLDVQVSQGGLSANEIERIAKAYANILKKTHDALAGEGFEQPLSALISMGARQLCIKL
jgi:hypothetical protein